MEAQHAHAFRRLLSARHRREEARDRFDIATLASARDEFELARARRFYLPR